MESILQGWLKKSPSEKKQFKLFGSKWRKRYFVLYSPPTVVGIPDAYTALLEYYTSKKLHNKSGTINLADCDEVLSNLDSESYKHVFGLHTKHKNLFRTYYLAAETETEMNKWVNRLCQVLGLTENDENPISPPSNQTPHPSALVMKVNHQIDARRMRPHILSPEAPPHPRPRPSAGSLSIPFTRLNVSESNLLDACSSKRYPPENRRDFSESVWQMPFTSKMRNAESVPELDRFSPAAIQREGKLPSERREFMQLPPIPPDKTGGQRKTVAGGIVAEGHGRGDEGLAYDQPKQRYYDRHDEELRRGIVVTPPTAVVANTDDDNSYNIPPTNRYKSCVEDLVETGWYSTPGGVESTHIGKKKVVVFPFGQTMERARGRHESKELYNIPPNQPAEDKSDAFYNVPNNLPTMNSNHCGDCHGDDRRGDDLVSIRKQRSEDCCNVPKSNDSQTDSTQDDNFYNVPKAQTLESYGTPNETRSYDVPSSSVFGSEHQSRPSQRITEGDAGKTYDVPKSKNVPKKSVYNVPGCQQKILTDELYNTPKHSGEETFPRQLSPHGAGLSSQAEGHQAGSYRPPKQASPLSRLEGVEGHRVEKQQSPAQLINKMQKNVSHLTKSNVDASAADEVYDVPPQHLSRPAVPKKPPRPLSRPSPDRQLVLSNVPVDVEPVTRPTSSAGASTSNDNENLERSENEKSEIVVVESPSEGNRESNTFKQNPSLKSSLSGHKRSFENHQSGLPVVHDSIRITQRTRSFKRSLPSQDRSALPLPIKRILERNESSSSLSSDENQHQDPHTTDDDNTHPDATDDRNPNPHENQHQDPHTTDDCNPHLHFTEDDNPQASIEDYYLQTTV